MVEFLSSGGRVSGRKLRLFAVACCRRVDYLLWDERLRWAVNVAERFAEGLARGDERTDAMKAAWAAWAARTMPAGAAARDALGNDPAGAAREAAQHAAWAVPARANELRGQADLLRDLVGPLPFRPVAIGQGLRTAEVLALAASIYDDRSWNDMPVLGDALQEAGCTDAEVQAHCHGPVFHARGCWLVDLLLNKE